MLAVGFQGQYIQPTNANNPLMCVSKQLIAVLYTSADPHGAKSMLTWACQDGIRKFLTAVAHRMSRFWDKRRTWSLKHIQEVTHPHYVAHMSEITCVTITQGPIAKRPGNKKGKTQGNTTDGNCGPRVIALTLCIDQSLYLPSDERHFPFGAHPKYMQMIDPFVFQTQTLFCQVIS